MIPEIGNVWIGPPDTSPGGPGWTFLGVATEVSFSREYPGARGWYDIRAVPDALLTPAEQLDRIAREDPGAVGW